MRWTEQVPASAIACGEGSLEVEADSGDLALALVKIGASAYVTARVSQAVVLALRSSPELAKRLSPLPAPEVVYRLGQPVALPSGIWQVPFWAYALPRESKP
jgi:hypothetical protein